MSRSHIAAAVCLAGILLGAPAASAVTISDVLEQDFDPTTTSPLDSFGSSAFFLTYDDTMINPDGTFLPGGRPGPGVGLAGVSNPDELIFNFVEGGGTGGGGGGGGGLPPADEPKASIYTLGNDLSGEWAMEFSMLFFDPLFAGTGVQIEIVGSEGGIGGADLTQAEVNAGKMLSWDIGADPGETVQVVVSPFGDQTYAAGFFMDEASFAVPEPATVAFVGLGALVLLRRRRK